MALEIRTHAVKGRGLYAARDIKAGETVLEEEPLLLMAAPDHARVACANCLRLVDQQSCLPCTTCQQAVFCSPQCSQAGSNTPWVHSPGICRAHQRIAASGLGLEDQGVLRFLTHALCLRHVQQHDPGQRYQAILSLVGVARNEDLHTAARLLPALTDALGAPPEASVEELATLLRKEQLNGYGVNAPHGPGGARKLRGSGLYARCSLINHECNPNVARFDAFDQGVTRIAFRAMHDLPAGSEVTQSYCPLNWSFLERQRQCREVYGFACNCPRCLLECQGSEAEAGSDGEEWETDDEDMEEEEEEAEEGHQTGGTDGQEEALRQLPPNPDEPAMEAEYLHLFLLKFVCPVPSCFGTMAPLPLECGQPDVSECNVCGGRRTLQQFLRELEEGHQHE